MRYEKEYIKILEEELKPVNGCTEPVSIAYAASIAKKYVTSEITKILMYASRSIIKNVKSVVVPNTNGLRGVSAAIAAGIVLGDESKKLLCISEATQEQINSVVEFTNRNIIEIKLSESDFIFDIDLFIQTKSETVEVRIIDDHDNLVLIKKNDEILFEKEIKGIKHIDLTDRSILSVEEIFEFVSKVDYKKIEAPIKRQIELNLAIAEEGLKNNYGANIGKTLLSRSNDILTKAKAYTAAGSDARMNGCNMPVVIISGSGNQGMTASIPVAIYAKELGCSEEKLIRAVALSDLLTLRVKEGIGILSAYCGAIAAGCCAGAAIAYLSDCDVEQISSSLINSLAIASGIICDGAKASCAAKIALAVESGIFGFDMHKQGNDFLAGEGIVKQGIENTILSVGKLASDGMVETDKEIVKLMLEK